MSVTFAAAAKRLDASPPVLMKMILERRIPHPRRVHIWSDAEFTEVQAAVEAAKKQGVFDETKQ